MSFIQPKQLKIFHSFSSAEGEGVWVVKSRAAAAPSSVPSVPAENTQPQQHPKARKPASPNICGEFLRLLILLHHQHLFLYFKSVEALKSTNERAHF